jgi:lysophospholipase L1-like esterase
VHILRNKLLAALLFSVSALVLCEVGARVVFTPTELMANPTTNFFLRDHPTRFWEMRPNLDVSVPDHGALQTNDLGLRNGPVSMPPPPGITRILSVGESSTWGQGVALEATYTKVLERLLTDRGWKVEAINAGVPAYSIWQVMVYLEETGLDLAPNWVVIYSQTNDFLPIRVKDVNRFLEKRTQTDRVLYEGRQPMAGFLHYLFQSRLFQVLRGPVVRSLPSEQIQSAKPGTAVRVPTEDRKLALSRIIELCRARGIELVIVQPFYEVDHTQDTVLRDMAVENQVRFVNAAQLRQQYAAQLNSLFFDGVHPTPSGHTLIAEVIADSMTQP